MVFNPGRAGFAIASPASPTLGDRHTRWPENALSNQIATMELINHGIRRMDLAVDVVYRLMS